MAGRPCLGGAHFRAKWRLFSGTRITWVFASFHEAEIVALRNGSIFVLFDRRGPANDIETFFGAPTTFSACG